jgi:C-terminal processing protease CtpA/Prc
MSLLNPLVCLALAASLPAFLTTAPAPAATAPRACDAAYLGVYVLSAEEGGATVNRVMPGSPAEEIGLQAGDRLVSLGGEKLEGADGLTAAIQGHQAGDEVEIVFNRGDQHMKKTVKLGKRAEAEAQGLFGGLAAPQAMGGLPQGGAGGGFPEGGSPQWHSLFQAPGQEGQPAFPFGESPSPFGAMTAPSWPAWHDASGQGDELEQRLDELRRRMDERFNDLSERLQALREERHDGAFSERMDRLQSELEAERADQGRRAEELKAALRSQAQAHQGQAQGQGGTPGAGFRPWGVYAGQPAASEKEVQALRDEVKELREEIKSLKELLTR